MCKKLICLILFMLVLGIAEAQAAVSWERAAYWDGRYLSDWVGDGVAMRDALQAAGYTVLDADQLKTWMDARIADKKLSVVVFCRDSVPDTVAETMDATCTVRKYLDAGGKIVWYADIPFYYRGYGDGRTPDTWGEAGQNALLGIGNIAQWDSGTTVTITTDGMKWGLTQTWASLRSENTSDVSVVLATDASGNAAAWVKHFVAGDTYRGFVRLFDRTTPPSPSPEDVMRVAEYSGYYKAWAPTPADGATNRAKSVLYWSPGDTAVTHDVYFGTDRTAVENADTSSPLCINPGITVLYSIAAVAKQSASTNYYWRIDEIEADGITIHKGDIWSFTTAPMKAHSPNPADGEVIVDLDTALSWGPGFTARYHEVYLGTDKTAVESANTSSTLYYKGRKAIGWVPGGLANSTWYYWRVDEVEPVQTNKYKGDVWSWSFTTPPPGLGTILRELWLNITPTGSTTISSLRNWPWYPDYPDTSILITSFDSPSYGDSLEQFGGRIHGWLYPPRTGDYTFYLATDDNGELWLSTDENPENAQLIAYEDSCAGDKAWEYGNERSAPIALQAGKRYYISALWKEGTGDDNCAVGWTGPGISTITVIPGSVLMPYVRLLAQNPSPRNNATMVPNTVALTWTPGDNAASHKVWFGTDPNAMELVATKPLRDEIYDPGPLELDTTYYWRVDEVNDTDPDSPWTGRLWRFTTLVLGDDCNGNGIPDDIDIATGTSLDCNGNGIPDECDIANGTSQDCNRNGIPDECEIDCNGNGIPDECDIASGTSLDCNGNGIPDKCDIAKNPELDCNGNGIPDECDIASGTSLDCNGNGIPDECDIAKGTSTDENDDGIPDECQPPAVRIVPIAVMIDPASTTEVRTTLPNSIEAVVRGSKYYLEIWASDIGDDNPGFTGVYVDISFCGQTSASTLEHGTVFTVFTAGDIQPGGVDEFGGSTFSSGVGAEPNWVRIGWLEMSANTDAPTCSISLLPSTTGVAAFGQGLVPWTFINLGSFDLQILPPARSYNLDGDSVIGVGDLSLFVPSWQQSVPPAQNAHDFDCDCFVGVGDLSWFATGWLKSPADPTILYPPCPGGGNCGKVASMDSIAPRGFTLSSLRPMANMSGAPADIDVAFELVVLNAPSASDTTTILPISIGSITQGQTYYVEVWVSDVGNISTGITSAYVDLHFPAAAASVTNISHGSIFTLFPSGSVAVGVIDELGGSQLSPGVGVAPQWARVAVIRMRADAVPPLVTFSLSPSSTKVASYGRGVVDWDDIALGIASVPPKITGFVRTPRGRGVNGVLLSADNGGGAGLTDTAGYYEVVVPQGWSGIVTPISAEFSLSFAPAGLSYGNVTNVFTNQNYVARNICDLNDDDKVSIVDFAYFADCWFQSGAELPANFDLSGAVSYSDLEIFVQNWLWTP